VKDTRAYILVVLCLPYAAFPAVAREVRTPEEDAQHELERRRQARPVLRCTPTSFKARAEQGQTTILSLSIRNAGGRTLKWSVVSAPSWIRTDRMSGMLGFAEEENLVFVADAKGRSATTLAGAIVIDASDAERSPVAIAVTLEIPEGKPLGEGRAPVQPRPEPPRAEAVATERASTEARIEQPRLERRRPEPSREARPPEAGRARPKTVRWAVQAGLLGPMPGNSQDFDPGAFGLVALRLGADDAGRKGLEFGLAYSQMSGPHEDTSMLLGRARGLFPLGAKGLYLSAGGQLVLDDADPDNDRFPDNVGATLDVGAVMRLAGRFEVGAAYSVLLASENVPGMLEFAVGVTF
jgi:hypothetical protein